MKQVLFLLLCFFLPLILSGQKYNVKTKKQKLTKKEKELIKIYNKLHDFGYKNLYRSTTRVHMCGGKANFEDYNWYKEDACFFLKNSFSKLMDKYPDWGDPYFLYALAVSMEDYKQANYSYKQYGNIKEAIPYFEKAFEIGFSNKDIVLRKFLAETVDGQRNYYSPAEFYLGLIASYYRDSLGSYYEFPSDSSFWTKIDKLVKNYSVGPYKLFFKSQKLLDQFEECLEKEDVNCAIEIYRELNSFELCDGFSDNEFRKFKHRLVGLQNVKAVADFDNLIGNTTYEYEATSIEEVKEIIESVLGKFSEEELQIVKNYFQFYLPKIADRGNSSGYLFDKNGVPIPDNKFDQVINKAIEKSYINFEFRDFLKIKLKYNIISVLDVGNVYQTTTTGGIVGKDTKNKKFDVKYLTSNNFNNDSLQKLLDFIEKKLELPTKGNEFDLRRLDRPRIDDKVTISYYISVTEVNPFIELIRAFNFSPPTTSRPMNQNGNEGTNADFLKKPNLCFSEIRNEFKTYLNCTVDEQKDKTQVFSVKCGDGKRYKFYKCLSPKGLISSNSDTNYYFEYQEFDVDTRLDKDKEISLRKLCDCN